MDHLNMSMILFSNINDLSFIFIFILLIVMIKSNPLYFYIILFKSIIHNLQIIITNIKTLVTKTMYLVIKITFVLLIYALKIF